jgi:excisionase family DNA binding protein
MQSYFLRNLSELAEKRAQNIRQEAQLWDILSRDLKREAIRREDLPGRRVVHALGVEQPERAEPKCEALYVSIPEAARRMGLGRSSLYKEINAGNIKVRKCGKRTLISVQDIHAWFAALPEGLSL